MKDIEVLKSNLADLEKERNRLFRGIGGRYSRKYRLKTNPETDKHKLKSQDKRIKTVKNRLISIGDEIHNIKNEILRHEVSNYKSSKQFNSLYEDTLSELLDS